ncbi:MAG: hypothetical protein ACNFW9_01050 [Candidatus Kerfeldbacteria bacterium]
MEKIKKQIVWVGPLIIVLLAGFFGMSQSGYESDILGVVQLIFALFILLLFAIMIFSFSSFYSWKTTVKKWVSDNNFNLIEEGKKLQLERINSNPNKSYFNTRNIKFNINNKYFVFGNVKGRKIWFYPFIGYPPQGSYLQTSKNPFHMITDTILPVDNSVGHIQGWCMEIETIKLPLTMDVYRTYVRPKDEIDTESNSFERLYHIDVKNGQGTLQLLDPVMIEIITSSKIVAYEFSDRSVALFYTMHSISRDKIDQMLNVGIKVAEQVDRNFPLGKYE